MVENNSSASERERLINEEIDAREKIESKSDKIARIIGIVLCLAVMFGIIAGIFYAISSRVIEYVNDKSDEGSRTHVEIVNRDPEITKIPENVKVLDVSDLAKKVESSIFTIQVQTEKKDGIFQSPVKTYRNLAGVLVADDGNNFYFLTDDAYTAEATKIYLAIDDNKALEAKRIGAAEALGLSVIVVKYDSKLTDEEKEKFKPIEFAEDNKASLGKPVMAIGSPNGIKGSIDYGYVTSGENYVSVADIKVEVMTSNMTYYNSGRGLVVNTDAEVCGIILKQNVSDAVFSFISTNEILVYIERFINEGYLPYAGVICEDMRDEDKASYGVTNGVYVNRVNTGSPAESAGIRSGDIIVAFGGELVTSVEDYTKFLFSHKKDELVKARIIRDGNEKIITIKIS